MDENLEDKIILEAFSKKDKEKQKEKPKEKPK